MNRVVFKLLADYARRTLGVWALMAATQMMQTSALWVNRSDRLPLFGAVIGALAFFATFDGPSTVVKTLPINRRDAALTRWWVAVGLPAMVVAASIVLAWWSNVGSGFPVPPPMKMWEPALASLAVLGALSILPLPMLKASRSNLPAFVAFWGMLAAGALSGLPTAWMPAPLSNALLVGGVASAIASFVRANFGQVVHVRPPRQLTWARRLRAYVPTTPPMRLKGGEVLVAQILKTTVVLALVSVIAVTALRAWFPAIEMHLPLIFVSVTGIAGSLLARRWLQAVSSLQYLPMRDSVLAMIVWFALMAPGFLTCVAATAVQWLIPSWGVAIPLFVMPVFAIVPTLLIPWMKVESSHATVSVIQQWLPVLQLAVWPAWAGSFVSLSLTQLMPEWFNTAAVLMLVVSALCGYFGVLFRIRAGTGLAIGAG